jgi:glycosyltransferase involved in cell wall biosynthesis
MALSIELPMVRGSAAGPTDWTPGFLSALNEHRVSVVVPALNEEKNLVQVLPRIPKWVHEVVLVDGHSTDGTVAVAKELIPDIRVVAQEGRGKGAALRTGFAAVGGDIIVMLDADGSTDPAEIPMFVGALLSGADFVKGSRFVQGGGTADMPLYRRVGHWVLLKLVQLCFGCHYSDLCYGYNAFWTHVLPLLNLDADGFEIETLMNVRALRARLKVMEVPSFEACRLYGASHLRTIPDGYRVLKTIVRERLKDRTGHVIRDIIDHNLEPAQTPVDDMRDRVGLTDVGLNRAGREMP